MALPHPECCPSVSSEFDLWTLPPTDTSVREGRWDAYSPIASLSDVGPVEFVITNADADTYLDLANTMLYVKAKILNGDGTAVAADKKVAPTNLWIQSMWRQVDVSLNDKLITPSTNMYPYRAYLETLLSYGKEAKKSQLSAALWYADTPGKFDTMSDTNDGFADRLECTAESRSVDMLGRLHCDMFLQHLHLLNNVTVRIRLTPAKDSFALMSDEAAPGYKTRLEEVLIFVRKVKITSGVQLGHLKALAKAPAKYPIRRVLTKYFSVPRGHTLINEQNLFLGSLPTRLVVGCVSNKAFDGDYTKNPFRFRHYYTNFVALYVGGRQIPTKPLTPDFENENFIRTYMNLFTHTGKAFHDEGNNIKRTTFAEGHTLFCFDLTPSLHDDHQLNLTCLPGLWWGQEVGSTLGIISPHFPHPPHDPHAPPLGSPGPPGRASLTQTRVFAQDDIGSPSS
ncbi:uncharacterized protein F54H12.2-like [Liolophura sinensis]|uniref:uncharacterized protein F54H12.2-like n=1 Tax=Liolophura sinensis TaxID=3198878 RepID=UPI00315966B6